MRHFEFGWRAADGIRIFAQGWESESPATAVICLVHGIGEHSGRYRHLGAWLQQRGFSVLAMDMRGHGRSEGKRGHAANYGTLLDDIGALLIEASEAYPDTPAILYGQSLGGNLVLNLALRRQPKLAGVVVTSPGLRLAFKPPAWQLLLGRIVRHIWPSFALARGTDYSAVSRDPAVIRALEADPLVHDFVSARLGLDIIEKGEWAVTHADELSLPLLLMHGGADQMASADASIEFAQRAGSVCTLKVWEGLYHELHNAPEKDEVFEFLLQWLQDTLAATY
jgi:alpha-beta hydrolase superfamily lysophospholipase